MPPYYDATFPDATSAQAAADKGLAAVEAALTAATQTAGEPASASVVAKAIVLSVEEQPRDPQLSPRRPLIDPCIFKVKRRISTPYGQTADVVSYASYFPLRDGKIDVKLPDGSHVMQYPAPPPDVDTITNEVVGEPPDFQTVVTRDPDGQWTAAVTTTPLGS